MTGRTHDHRAAALLATLALLAGPAAGQQLLFSVEGAAAGDALGASLALTDDRDGDGLVEWIVGSPGAALPGAETGRVQLLDGSDGSELFAWQGAGEGDQFGAAVADAGDVDDDGVRDVIVGAPQDVPGDTGWNGAGPGYAQVFSGADGSLLYSWQGETGLSPRYASFGRAVAGVGDLDGDGHDDVAVAEREADVEVGNQLDAVGGRVWVFSGADGSVLRRIDAVGPTFAHLGWSLAGGPDVNADGVPDLVAGAPIQNTGTAGFVIVSGATGGALSTVYTGAHNGLGISAAWLGDVDDDGVPDVAVGTGDQVQVHSGADGALLHASQIQSGASAYEGVRVARCPDFDGDGRDDVLLGAPENNGLGADSGRVQIHSGLDGELLVVLPGKTSGARLGAALGADGDRDEDGVVDLLLGEPGWDGAAGAGSGRLSVWSTQGAETHLTIASPNAADIDFGQRVASVGDVDDDGWGDLAVGLPNDGSVHPSGGRVQVFSGRDGSLLHDWTAPDALYRMGWSVAGAGDVDKDGHDDVIAGLPYPHVSVGPPEARIWSGRDGSLLHVLTGPQGSQFGTGVTGLGDIDGDGHDDVAVGAPNDATPVTTIGVVRAYSGATGQELLSMASTLLLAGEFGATLASAGDVDADGIPDVLIGARGASTASGGAGSGQVVVHSGADGEELYRWDGPGVLAAAGRSVAGVGDVDLDGRGDVAYGMTGHGPHGVVLVRSGVDGSILHELSTELDGVFGLAVARVGDVDGDGHDDVAVGLPGADDAFPDAGAVRCFSGLTGEVVLNWAGQVGGDQAGTALSGGHDLDNDGRLDLVAGAITSNGNPALAGLVHVISPQPADTAWRSVGQRLPGTLGSPRLLGTGTLEAGAPTTLELTGALPNSSTAMVFGFTAIDAVFKGGVLVPSVDLLFTGLPTWTEGALSVAAPWPAGVPSGFELYVQHWISDPGGPAGLAASNAVVGTAP